MPYGPYSFLVHNMHKATIDVCLAWNEDVDDIDSIELSLAAALLDSQGGSTLTVPGQVAWE